MSVRMIYLALLIGSGIAAYRDRWDVFALCVIVMIVTAFHIEE